MNHIDLWSRLAMEGRFDVIRLLSNVEAKKPGFGTVVVPYEGFSEDDGTHNMVLDWLTEQGTNIVNVGLEIARLERDLKGA